MVTGKLFYLRKEAADIKVLVTGGAGFIGSHIVDVLLQFGYQPVIIDNLSTGDIKNIPQGVPFYCEDINSENLKEIFLIEKPTFVIHQAAQVDIQTSQKNPTHDAKVNILGLLNVLECSVRHQVKKFVFASSAAVYGNPDYLAIDESHPLRPQSAYGISKSVASMYLELFAKLYGLEYVVLRYSNVYGPRQGLKGEGGLIPSLIVRLFKQEAPIIYGDGSQTRDFIYVKDVASANLRALEIKTNNILNISTNTQSTVLAVSEMLMRILNTWVEPIFKEGRSGEILHSCLDNKRARETLLWEPNCSLESGLTETVKYYRKLGRLEEIEKPIDCGRTG